MSRLLPFAVGDSNGFASVLVVDNHSREKEEKGEGENGRKADGETCFSVNNLESLRVS